MSHDRTSAASGRRPIRAIGTHRFFGEPTEKFGSVEDLGTCVGKGFAVFGGDEQSEFVDIAHHEFERTAQYFGPFAGRHGAPGRQRSVCRVDGGNGVAGAAVGHSRYRFTRRRIVDIEASGRTRGPYPANEQALAGLECRDGRFGAVHG